MAATLLWRHLRVDISLYDADRPRFNALLSSSPNGILDNVKELSIFASRTRPSHVQKEQTTSVLLRLLSVLPQDKLMTFHSGTLPVHPDVICVLLRTQSQLREVAMLVDERNLDGLPEGIHVRNNLSQMEKITFDVAGVQHQTYRSAGVWLVHTPKLHDLTIKGRDSGLNAFKGWIPPIHSNLVKLRRLAIHDVYLKDLPIGITKNLQLPSLEHLSLRECSNAAPFLLSLAQKFKQTDNPALESFEHCGVSVQEDAQEACAKLIESVNGLKDITVGVMTGAVLDLQCLGSNSTSLRRLDLVCDDDDIEYYSAEDLVQLKFLCPALEWLSVNLGHLSSVFDDVALSEAFVLAEHREYVQKLVSLQSRHQVRGAILNPPRKLLPSTVACIRFRLQIHLCCEVSTHLMSVDSCTPKSLVSFFNSSLMMVRVLSAFTSTPACQDTIQKRMRMDTLGHCMLSSVVSCWSTETDVRTQSKRSRCLIRSTRLKYSKERLAKRVEPHRPEGH